MSLLVLNILQLKHSCAEGQVKRDYDGESCIPRLPRRLSVTILYYTILHCTAHTIPDYTTLVLIFQSLKDTTDLLKPDDGASGPPGAGEMPELTLPAWELRTEPERSSYREGLYII